MSRSFLCFAATAISACASAPPPPASSVHFGAGAAREAAALASARTPEEKSAALLDILSRRVDQMESAASAGQDNHLASLVNAYRRLALEALPGNLASAGTEVVQSARTILTSHEARLNRIAGARDAFLACRFVLASLPPR